MYETKQLYLSGRNELNELFELIQRTQFDWLNSNVVFFGLASKFRHEAIGRFVADKYDASFAQALNGPVQTARGGSKINDNVDLTLTSINGAID